MQLPTIHLNGTGAETLAEGYYAAMNAVREAIESFERIEFNGRDYYPQGPEAWTAAVTEQRSRVARLKAVYDELEIITTHCYDAVSAKEARIAEQQKRYATA